MSLKDTRFVLYIPHGSDESASSNSFSPQSSTFISHMVQMKAKERSGVEHSRLYFISHMVQMKERDPIGKILVDIGFISHMVQMKELH